MQESDPFGIGSYMRSRMRELLGNDILGGGVGEPFDVPRFVLNEPEIQPLSSTSSFYINPDVEWAFPEAAEAVMMPLKGPAQISEKARGHRPIPGLGTEILETPNARPARPPRRLFRVDVTENDEFYFLRADLAGMTKENVKISVDENQNLISFNVEPPKDDFFGLYKSPLESQLSMKESETKGSDIKEASKGTDVKEPLKSTESKESGVKEPLKSKESKESDVKEPLKAAESKESIVKEKSKEEPESKEHLESPPTLSHKKEVCHLIERSTHPMTRTLKLPKAVDMAKVEAEMREGLLVVKFAKKRIEPEEMKKHSIEIK